MMCYQQFNSPSLLYGLTVFILLFAVVPASAAEITVTTTTDVVNGDVSSPSALQANPGSDGISLREAILVANGVAGPHVINFSTTLADQTIAVTSPLFITRNGVTITGLSTQDGQPNITLDAGGITVHPGTRSLFFIYASDFALTLVRITRVTQHAIRIQAGQTIFPPAAPQEVRNIRIEDNVFDNTGIELDSPLIENPFVDAIRVWTDPAGVAVDATITNVRIARNTFRRYIGNGVYVGTYGTNCVIRDTVIQDNTFLDTGVPVELNTATASNNRVVGTRIIGNTFFLNKVYIYDYLAIFIGPIGRDSSSPASGGLIDDTLIAGNVIKNSLFGFSVNITGGIDATENTVRNTRIINNLISGGIIVIGGAQGSRGNRVEGVQITSNTIIKHGQGGGGVGIVFNSQGGTGNTVTGVTILNTILWGPGADFPTVTGPPDQVTPDQVRFCITTQQGYAGINGNISADPKFVNLAQGDFHLQAGSPAIDAGTSEGAPVRDLEGRERFDDPATPNSGGGTTPFYDIGAFEFGSPPASLLTVTKAGTGNGTVTSSPAGVNCGADCRAGFNIGTVVTLTPSAATGSTFVGWSGDPDCSDGVVTVTSNKTCTAAFQALTPTPTPGLTLFTEENSARAIALDSVTFLRDPFPIVATHNFSPDRRTRVMLFATNLELLPGENASAVTAQAEDAYFRMYPLTVEYVGKVPNFDWLTQVNVKLPDELMNIRDVWVSIRLRGAVSNRALISIKTSGGSSP